MKAEMQALPQKPNLKLLPPYPTSLPARRLEEKKRISECVDFLLEYHDPTLVRLFSHLMTGIIWDEEIEKQVLEMAWRTAVDFYDCSTPNVPYEDTLADSNNPRNWKGCPQQYLPLNTNTSSDD